MILFTISFYTYLNWCIIYKCFMFLNSCTQNKVEHLLQNMIHQAIEIPHSMLVLIYQIHCLYMTVCIVFMHTRYWDLLKQYIYLQFPNLFYQQRSLLIYRDLNIVSILHSLFLHTFYVVYFARYIDYVIFQAYLSNYLNVFHYFNSQVPLVIFEVLFTYLIH